MRHFYPETGARGFSRADGIIAFYTRIHAVISPKMIVVDFGAGRGRGVVDDPILYRRALRTLKGKCRKVIDVDVDPAVREYPSLGEVIVVREAQAIPLPDSSVDLIVSDATFEHIVDPKFVTHELDRILKPGGYICARTPNRWGYIGIGVHRKM